MTSICSRTPLVAVLSTTLILACVDRHDPATEEAPAPIRLEVDLRIDGYAADLVPIAWLGVSSNGTLALIQSQDSNVRFFDADGNDLGSVGRSGAGPGEFRRPGRGGWIGDTLWVSDSQLNRVTLISPELEILRSLPPLTAAVPRIADRDRLPTFTVVFPYALYEGDVALAGAIGSAGDPLAEAFKGLPLIRVTSDGQIDRLILETPEDAGSIPVQFENGMGSVSIPFFPRPDWAVSPDGRRITTVSTDITGSDGGTFQVALYDAQDGSTIFDRVYPFEGVPVPSAAADSALAASSARMPRPEMRRALDNEAKGRIPPAYAPVVDIFVGADDRVWVGLRKTVEGNPWLILGSTGEPVGTVVVPDNVTLRVADAVHVWGLEKDDVGVESPVRFRLSGT